MTDENGVNVPTNNRKKTRTFGGYIGYYVRNGVTAQPPGRHRTAGEPFHAPGHRRGDYFRPSGNGDFAPCGGKSGAKRGGIIDSIRGAPVIAFPVQKPQASQHCSLTLPARSEGSLKVQGWSASGGRAEVVSDAEGTGGKAVKLTKEAGKSSWVLEYAAGNGAALLQKGGADSLPL